MKNHKSFLNILILYICLFSNALYAQSRSLKKAYKALLENNLNEYVELMHNIKREDSSNFLFFYTDALYTEKSSDSDVETKLFIVSEKLKNSLEYYKSLSTENKMSLKDDYSLDDIILKNKIELKLDTLFQILSIKKQEKFIDKFIFNYPFYSKVNNAIFLKDSLVIERFFNARSYSDLKNYKNQLKTNQFINKVDSLSELLLFQKISLHHSVKDCEEYLVSYRNYNNSQKVLYIYDSLFVMNIIKDNNVSLIKKCSNDSKFASFKVILKSKLATIEFFNIASQFKKALNPDLYVDAKNNEISIIDSIEFCLNQIKAYQSTFSVGDFSDTIILEDIGFDISQLDFKSIQNWSIESNFYNLTLKQYFLKLNEVINLWRNDLEINLLDYSDKGLIENNWTQLLKLGNLTEDQYKHVVFRIFSIQFNSEVVGDKVINDSLFNFDQNDKFYAIRYGNNKYNILKNGLNYSNKILLVSKSSGTILIDSINKEHYLVIKNIAKNFNTVVSNFGKYEFLENSDKLYFMCESNCSDAKCSTINIYNINKTDGFNILSTFNIDNIYSVKIDSVANDEDLMIYTKEVNGNVKFTPTIKYSYVKNEFTITNPGDLDSYKKLKFKNTIYSFIENRKPFFSNNVQSNKNNNKDDYYYIYEFEYGELVRSKSNKKLILYPIAKFVDKDNQNSNYYICTSSPKNGTDYSNVRLYNDYYVVDLESGLLNNEILTKPVELSTSNLRKEANYLKYFRNQFGEFSITNEQVLLSLINEYSFTDQIRKKILLEEWLEELNKFMGNYDFTSIKNNKFTYVEKVKLGEYNIQNKTFRLTTTNNYNRGYYYNNNDGDNQEEVLNKNASSIFGYKIATDYNLSSNTVDLSLLIDDTKKALKINDETDNNRDIFVKYICTYDVSIVDKFRNYSNRGLYCTSCNSYECDYNNLKSDCPIIYKLLQIQFSKSSKFENPITVDLFY
jgi:hypothetical protein